MKRSPLRRKRATHRRSGRLHWPEYMACVREFRCYACVFLRFEEPLRHVGVNWYGSEADHQGEHPYGRKADDDTCVPMCEYHHRLRTDGFLPDESIKGYKRVSKEEMRAWCSVAIEATRAVVIPLLASRGIHRPKT